MPRNSIRSLLGSSTIVQGRTTCSSPRQSAFLSRTASTAVTSRSSDKKGLSRALEQDVAAPERRFLRMSTMSLLRCVILGQVFRMPLLFRSGLYALEKVAHSQSSLLNTDKNPLLRLLVYPVIYKQFCAGRNKTEIRKTIADIKRTGYSGVILCYSKEIMAKVDPRGQQVVEDSNDAQQTRRDIEAWKQGNITTLSTVSAGDYIGVKFTGAGPTVSQALKSGHRPSEAMLNALYEICDQAQAENKRLWIDAEQQIYHPTIDEWAVGLMRKYNRNGDILVLTTVQSYLKSSRQTVEWYLRQAMAEGWALGIKLVRGAYINSDVRSKIHDTKAETDASYDGIAHDVLTKQWPGFDTTTFPDVKIFLTGHNANSIRKLSALAQDLAASGELKEPVHYGQLQGMADDIGCEMLCMADKVREVSGKEESVQGESRVAELGVPKLYKCLTWGSVQDCLHYLVRRAVENRSAAENMGEGLKEMRAELRRRLFRF